MRAEPAINYPREAFFHPFNLGFLFLAGLTTFFVSDLGAMSLFTITVAIGAELVYLGTIPHSEWFQQLVKRRYLSARDTRQDEKELFYTLDTKSQKRFLKVKHLSERIRQNFVKFPDTSQGLTEAIGRKIDGLSSNYLFVLDSTYRFEQYVATTKESHLNSEIAEAEQELAEATSEKLRDIKRRRLVILRKRLDRLKSAKEKLHIGESQLETIEDAISYIYEQSITMSNPEELGIQLDTLLTDVEETVTIIEDVEDEALPGYHLIEKMEADEAEAAALRPKRSAPVR